MDKEFLKNLKLKIQALSDIEKTERDLYLRKIALGEIYGPMTGYSSIDKPWLKVYPEQFFCQRKKYNKIYSKLKDIWQNEEDIIIEYYGSNITVKEFFDKINMIAKSLKSMGIKCGDSIISSLESVPEFVELLFACEILGCSIKNYIGDNDSLIDLINNNKDVKFYFTPDYLSNEDMHKIYENTNIQNIITIDPLYSVKDKSKVKENIISNLKGKYINQSCDIKNIKWDEFLSKGKDEIIEISSVNNVLYSGFTSGSTGTPKEVKHTSESIMGIVNQLTLSFEKENDESWLLTILPPSLVAVVVSMICYPLADGKKLILDPYCKLEDIDIQMMDYKPNGWAFIPLFFDVLINSDRIPENYDMSHFKIFGYGAEPMTRAKMHKIIDFKKKHNCNASLSTGYGQSEGGSDFTTTIGEDMLLAGSSGIPLIDTTIGIFKPGTMEELEYNEIGEICKSGPGIMVGYCDENLTEKMLKRHYDGNLWLHTGDSGFMTKEGLLYVLGRAGIKVSSNKIVFPLNIENQIESIKGVKDAIIVPGKNIEDENYEIPYLFIIPEKGVIVEELLKIVNDKIKKLVKEEQPKDVFVIDEKPIYKFKTDRRTLRKTYKL